MKTTFSKLYSLSRELKQGFCAVFTHSRKIVKFTFTKSLKSAFYCVFLFCLLGQHLVNFTFFAVKIRNFASSKSLDR